MVLLSDLQSNNNSDDNSCEFFEVWRGKKEPERIDFILVKNEIPFAKKVKCEILNQLGGIMFFNWVFVVFVENGLNPGKSIGLRFILWVSDLFREIPVSVSEPIEKIFCISFDARLSKINPIQTETSFQSESILARIDTN